MSLIKRKILLGVTGGIAAYKSAYLVRLLVKAGADVQVVMTEAGAKFVTPLTFESLTNREVAVEMFPKHKFVGTRHISLAEWPDLIVIAPATADFLAQIANGFCSSLLSTIICATKRPVILAPAMNDGMYSSPAVQKNIIILGERGFNFAEVGIGDMACDSYGPGRMAEPDDIFERIVQLIAVKGPLSGKKVIVTAGPCREPIDPVRYISNRSSGKMGFAIADEASGLGADVVLITGPVAIDAPENVNIKRIETTEEMAVAVQKEFETADYLIMAAAPADYKAKNQAPQKIKKNDKEGITIEFSPSIDILKSLMTQRKDSQTVAGFALETENAVENGMKKLKEKGLDYIVINNALENGAGFEADTNRVVVVSKTGKQTVFEKTDKRIIARSLWELILSDG